MRKDLLEFEQFIQGRVAIYDELRAKTMGEDIAKSHHLIADLDTVSSLERRIALRSSLPRRRSLCCVARSLLTAIRSSPRCVRCSRRRIAQP